MPLIHHNGYIAIVFYIIWSEGEFSSFTTFFIQWQNSNWKWTFNGFIFFTSISRLMEWNEVTIIQIQTCNDTCFRIESFMLWLFNIETMHSKKKERIERTKGTFNTENIERTGISIAWKSAENDFSTAQSAKREPWEPCERQRENLHFDFILVQYTFSTRHSKTIGNL